MANGDIFYSRLSFGTIHKQFFGIFQFLKRGSFSSPLVNKGEKKIVGTQRVKLEFIVQCLEFKGCQNAIRHRC